MSRQWTEEDFDWLITEGSRLKNEAERDNQLPKKRDVTAWLKRVEAWMEAEMPTEQRAAIDSASDPLRKHFLIGGFPPMSGKAFAKHVENTVGALVASAGGYAVLPEPQSESGLNSARILSARTGQLNVTMGDVTLTAHGAHGAGKAPPAEAEAEDPDRTGGSPPTTHERKVGLSVAVSASSSLEVRSAPGGSAWPISRKTHPDEHSLRVDEYAQALASLMEMADDEFCFAVYGHWGRGKTFLAEQLRDRLQQSAYEPVWFSAWKYRTTPEMWAFLYETFARAARDRGVWTAVPRAVRTHVIKQGMGSIIALLGLLSIMILGLGILPVIISIIGVIGVLKGYAVYRWTRKLPPRMFSLPQHGEKLGLQATIGDDLVALLKGWIPLRGRARAWAGRTLRGRAKVWAGRTTRVLCWSILYAGGVFAVVYVLNRTLHGKAWLGLPLYPCEELRQAFQWIILAAGLVLPLWVIFSRGKTKRIALVIDDLDRCAPLTMLEVIESLKLLLEDPEVSSRVQVIMLIEEHALRHAIAERYKHHEALVQQDSADDAKRSLRSNHLDRTIDESLEKLFVAHLRLPPLNLSELTEVMGKYVEQHDLVARMSEQQRAEVKRQRTELAVSQAAGGGAGRPPPEAPSVLVARGSAPTAAPDLDLSKALFTPDERKALIYAVQLLVQRARGPELGPRALRTFLTRYQLAKLLLTIRQTHWDPGDLILYLANGKAADNADPNVRAVVAEVS